MPGWNYQNQFWCVVDNDGFIVASDYTGSRKIGVTMNRYGQMEQALEKAIEKAEGYLKQLEDNGIIKRELTQEERVAMLSEQVEKLTRIAEQQQDILLSIQRDRQGTVKTGAEGVSHESESDSRGGKTIFA